MNKFYVYFLSDPLTNVPFYIGKGCGRRAYRHLTESLEQTDNRRKWRKIEKIRLSGNEPIVTFIKDNLSEEEAHTLEISMISAYGRKGFEENGVLTNLTNGGDGVSGYRHTDETKQMLRDMLSGEKHPQFGKSRSDKTKNLISTKQIGKKSTTKPDTGKKMSELMRSKEFLERNAESRKRSISALVNRVRSKDEYIKISKKLKGRTIPPEEHAKRIANQPPMTDEIRAKISATKKGKPWTEARRSAQLNRKKGAKND